MRKNKKIIGFLIILVCALLMIPVNTHASAKTDELIKRIAPDGKNAIIKSVKPKSEDDSFGMLTGLLQKTFNTNEYYSYGFCEAPNFNVCHVEFQSEDYVSDWDPEAEKEIVLQGERASYTLNATYDEPSKENIDLVNKYVSKLKNASHDEPSSWYMLEDLSLINYYMTSSKSELWNAGAAGRALKYVGELNKLIDGTELSFDLEANMGNQDETLMYESAFGFMTIFYGEHVYSLREDGIYLKRIIYIPENTENTKEAYIKAAQKRINDYLGNDEVKVTYGGLISSLEEGSEDEENPVVSDGNYYNIKVLDRTYKFYIIKGAKEKLVNPIYNGKSLKTDITITSTDASVPLDTTITANKLTSGEEYEKITEKLNLTDNVTYDLKLYSTSSEKYISKLENGSFDVKIPIPEKFKDKTLYVYYVKDDGIIETYDVEYAENKKYAVFNTNHFSIYTIGYKEEISKEISEEIENPKTSDNILISVIVLIISTISLILSSVYYKKPLK